MYPAALRSVASLLLPTGRLAAGLVILLGLAAAGAGCGGGGGGDPEPGSCVPGMTVSCACPGGGQGVQTCNAAGTFSSCQCPMGTGGSGGSGGRGGSGGSGGSGGLAGRDAGPDLPRDSAPDTTPAGTASLRVTVVDASDSPIAQAVVKVLIGGVMRGQATTGANGIATVSGLVAGEYSVQASATRYDPASKAVAVADGATAETTLQLIPSDAYPAGGTQRTQAIAVESGGTLVFEVDLFVLDRLGRPVDGLAASAFSIESFTSDGDTLSFALQSMTPLTKTAKDPYSAYLMLDQSGSISSTDPGNLRLQAAKIFLGKLGTGDQVVVGAFASSGSLPYEITQYQGFTTDGRSYFPTIDMLATKEGGGTPLYKAAIAAIRTTAEQAPTSNKAALIFTDGEDTGGGWTIDQIIAEANRLSVPLHMVGLGKDTKIDVLARLAYGTGGSYMQAVDAGQLIALYGNLGALLRGSTGGYRTRWTATMTPTSFAGLGGWFWTDVVVQTPAGKVYVPIWVKYPG